MRRCFAIRGTSGGEGGREGAQRNVANFGRGDEGLRCFGVSGGFDRTPYDYCPVAGALKTEYVEAGAREREKVTGEYRKLFRLYLVETLG